MTAIIWLSNNYIELFGAIAGIIYVFLEIRQNAWLWPVGIITSAVYIWIFFGSKFYADMSLQVYYLIISCLGWYWWIKGTDKINEGERRSGIERESGGMGESACATDNPDVVDKSKLEVTRLKLRVGIILAIVFMFLFAGIWIILSRFTDSPVPGWDSLITSLSIVATWMLARKIYEHWYLWIVVNFVSTVIFVVKGLYPTVILYLVYGIMSFVGLKIWKSTIREPLDTHN